MREAQLGFEALSIEGGLLSPDWLTRVAQLAAGSQSEADYRIPKGLNLRDEIGRYWRIAQAHWQDLTRGRAAQADPAGLAASFITSLLRESCGFASLAAAEAVLVAERYYPIGYAALGGRVPVVIAQAGSGLDTLSAAFGDAGRRRSAFGLAQEFLNAYDGALWGVVSDGLVLRIVRDNASLTRPAWIEADLQRTFTEERYSDFAALWLLLHETRFGRPDQPASECALEAWRSAGLEEGTRAREHLRGGVEDALAVLGQGFLTHPENHALRAALHGGSLSTRDYFNQLLRLAYRLIFLLTVEERGLLHSEDTGEVARTLYAQGYSLRRLRERAVKRSAHDRFSDLWEATKIVLRGLAAGEPRLGLPALAGLFAPDQCPALEVARVENRALLLAIFRLAWLRQDGSLARVNWRDMGPEELGSVYESLLELVPQISREGREFAFARGGETKGHARKTTGSYYTPDSLVQVLLDTALEPVVADTMACNPSRPIEGLLELSIVDPACGSGHFLLAAARRVAAHVARLQANGTPSAAEYRHALRKVIGRCVYGVDLNPMAVELCKMSLWMEAVEPGLPLTFLNSHIQHGNSLLGTTPELMQKGIPDSAWEPVEGDDKKTASNLKVRNKKAALGQRSLDTLWAKPSDSEAQAVTRAVTELEAQSDASPVALAQKESQWDAILKSVEYRHQKLVADAWCAAFVWPKEPGELAAAAPTNELWRQLRDGQGQPAALTAKTVQELAEQYRFFHWHLQFPQVFAKGGFDLVLGNPPWDELTPAAKEFFAVYEPEVRFQDARGEKEIVDRLLEDPAIECAWKNWCRTLFAEIHYLKNSGRYTLFAPGNLGKGDLNVYRMFVESAMRYCRSGGIAAQFVPEALYNSANASAIRRALIDEFEWRCLDGFENAREVWFKNVDTRAKFCLYVAAKGRSTAVLHTRFGIRTEEAAANRSGTLAVPTALLRKFSPDALSIMEFSCAMDIDIAAKMYSTAPTFGDATAGPPYREYMRELDMTVDRHRFTENPRALPIYEGRMVDAFDHRAKEYVSGRGRAAHWRELAFGAATKRIAPQWFVEPDNLPEKLGDRTGFARLGVCKIGSPTNERTFVACLIPPGSVCGNSVATITFGQSYLWAHCVWLCVANAFVLDFLVRKMVSLNLTNTIIDGLPFPRLQRDDGRVKTYVELAARLTCTSPELSCFWDALAADGWVSKREEHEVPGLLTNADRQASRDEIDARVAFELFGFGREQLEYVMDSFPIVRKNDEKAHGEYRTKRVILEIYDAMAEAARTGTPYQTRLTRPPADPRVANPDTRAKR